MASIGSFVLSLFGIRTITQGFIPVDDEPYIEFDPAAFTVTNDAVNQRNIVALAPAASPTLGALTVTSLTIGGKYAKWQPTVTTTTNATSFLFQSAVAIPSGKKVVIHARLSGTIVYQSGLKTLSIGLECEYANLLGTAFQVRATNASSETSVPGQPWAVGSPATVTGAADSGAGLIRLTVNSTANYASGNTETVAGLVGSGGLTAAANGQWIVTVIDGTHLDLKGSAFVGAYTSGGTVTPNGAIGLSLIGTTVQVYATGIKAAGWMQGEAVNAGAIRSNANGTYICGTSGTTLGSGAGPSGTGTNIDDNGVKWDYLGAGTAVPITWGCYLETFTFPTP